MIKSKLPVLFVASLLLAAPVFAQQGKPKTDQKPKTDLQEKSGEKTKAPTPVTYDAGQKTKATPVSADDFNRFL